MPQPRPLHDHAALRRVLNPNSVAVIGASPRPGAFGERVLANLADFSGEIWPVNARYERIGERRCYPSLAALPGPADCAVVTVGREAVDDVVADCIAAAVGGIIVFASGYAETGKPDRIAQQTALAARARAAGVPLIGPNCIGVSLHAIGARITFMPSAAAPQPGVGAIGVVSQSGALGYALGQATERGVPVSHILTSGNSSDVDMADYVAYLADDPTCAAIALLFEGMSEPARLIAAAERARAAGKALVVCKLAVGAEGAQAALSHTGSLAGAQAAYRAALDRAGAVVVETCEALMETAAFFAKAPPPRGRGVAVIATSGGAAIMAADKAEAHGVPLPQPNDAARAVLAARIPEFGSARNPVDITAQVLNDPESLPTCARALLADDAYSSLVVPIVYSAATVAARMPMYEQLAVESGKPVALVWLAEWMEGPGTREAEANRHTPLFRSMDRCLATIAAWHRRADRLAASHAPPAPVPVPVAPVPVPVPAAARARAASLLAAASGQVLGEREAKAALAEYGVPVVAERLVTGVDDAIVAAAAAGYPVVLKVESPDLPHKTEAGVIRLDLRDAGDVRDAFAAIHANAARVVPPPRITGVLVQPMVPAGVEILVGARVDPLFGPLIVVGLGGVFVELLQDRAVGLAPVSHDEARRMLTGLKGAAVLGGFRGSPAVDLDALADVVVRIGQFAADHADAIAEIDVNPLICAGDRILAVDALIARAERA